MEQSRDLGMPAQRSRVYLLKDLPWWAFILAAAGVIF